MDKTITTNKDESVCITTVDNYTGEGLDDLSLVINSDVGYAGLWLTKEEVIELINHLKEWCEI